VFLTICIGPVLAGVVTALGTKWVSLLEVSCNPTLAACADDACYMIFYAFDRRVTGVLRFADFGQLRGLCFAVRLTFPTPGFEIGVRSFPVSFSPLRLMSE